MAGNSEKSVVYLTEAISIDRDRFRNDRCDFVNHHVALATSNTIAEFSLVIELVETKAGLMLANANDVFLVDRYAIMVPESPDFVPELAPVSSRTEP